MKKIIVILLFATSCASLTNVTEEQTINKTLNSWHLAAGQAQFQTYFDFFTDDAIFIGTDATENWNKNNFMEFAKPYFDKGKAWNFKALERHIYFSNDLKTAWFDELLQTQMKICRGSGVLVKTKQGWKIKHYVLSMTIPNENTNEVLKIKAPIEDDLIEKLQKK